MSTSAAARSNGPSNAWADRVTSVVKAELRRRVATLREQGRDPDDLGPPEELAAKMLATVPQLSPWRELGPFYSTKGVARLLAGVSRQAIEERRRRRSILALRTDDGVWVYPAFQFDTRNRVLRGLADVLACFDSDDDWTLAALLTTGQVALGGASIVEWLRGGEPLEPVMALARDVAARWAA